MKSECSLTCSQHPAICLYPGSDKPIYAPPPPFLEEKNEKCTKYFDLNGSEQLKELGVDGKIILRQTLKERGGMAWNGIFCLSIGSTVRFL